MYTVSEVSTIVEKSKSTVQYHIEKGYLKASKNSTGSYVISQTDLDNYLQDYIYSDQKRENVAYNSGKKLNLDEFTKLIEFIDFVKETSSIEDVIKKYEKLEIKLPSLEAFFFHQRNESLVKDYESQVPMPQLMKTYNLSSDRIYAILRKQREF